MNPVQKVRAATARNGVRLGLQVTLIAVLSTVLVGLDLPLPLYLGLMLSNMVAIFYATKTSLAMWDGNRGTGGG
jgi:hypothetical protein